MEPVAFINAVIPIEKGRSKKKNLRTGGFLNCINTSISTIKDSTIIEKFKSAIIVMETNIERQIYQPLMAKISAAWSFVSGFSIMCLTIPASSIKNVVLVVLI